MPQVVCFRGVITFNPSAGPKDSTFVIGESLEGIRAAKIDAN